MRSLTQFFTPAETTDRALEHEFRRVYRQPSLRYVQAAFAFGTFSPAAFFLVDIAAGRPSVLAWLPALRAAFVLAFGLALAVSYWRRDLILRHYTVVINIYSALGMLGMALFPLAVHLHRPAAEIFWSLSSSLTAATVVIYGFSRLTTRNTAAIVTTGCALGVFATVAVVPDVDGYSVSRLAMQLTVVNIAAYGLCATVERRERQLFLLARDNLSKNIYAKEIELARAQAEEGNEVKLRFLANMSHEFRTPMHGVMQALEMAARTARGDLAGRLERARESGQALLSTLNGILEYSRWTHEGLVPRPTRVSLSERLREAVQRQGPSAAERGLTLALRLDLASADDAVLVDELMLVEVIGRLLDNALRFTPRGRVDVGVELARREDAAYPVASLVLTIADTGVGIPQDRAQAIFTPFYQLDDASNRKVGGTGLGLAIVKRLVEVMGGSVALTSVLGSGSTFRVRLPVEICVDAAPSKRLRSARAIRPSATDPTETLEGAVLLVDDNQLNAELTAELLTLMGLRVTLATDGAEAHREAHARGFDVVLMDCQMPNVDGYEATRRIRQTERASLTPPVPIVAVTANALAGDRERCMAAGMNDYLAKPYTAAQLRAKLTRWLPPRAQPSDPSSDRVAARSEPSAVRDGEG